MLCKVPLRVIEGLGVTHPQALITQVVKGDENRNVLKGQVESSEL